MSVLCHPATHSSECPREREGHLLLSRAPRLHTRRSRVPGSNIQGRSVMPCHVMLRHGWIHEWTIISQYFRSLAAFIRPSPISPVQFRTLSIPASLCISRTGIASDWCALKEALYNCIDTIQYNTIYPNAILGLE